MTAEKFQDAISLLSTDLIAETDKLRCAPRRVKLHWGRWASMAACLAVILYSSWLLSSGIFTGSGTKSSDVVATVACADAAPASAERIEDFAVYQGEAAPEEEAATQEIPDAEAGANQKSEIAGSTSGSRADVNACLTPLNADSTLCFDSQTVMVVQTREELDTYYEDFSGAFRLDGLYESLESYDEAWFANHDLLLVRTVTDAEDTVPEIVSLTQTGGDTWEVTLSHSGKESRLYSWHLWMETEKDLIPDGTKVTLTYEQEG